MLASGVSCYCANVILNVPLLSKCIYTVLTKALLDLQSVDFALLSAPQRNNKTGIKPIEISK